MFDNAFVRFMSNDMVFWPLIGVLLLLVVGFFIVRKMKPRDDDE